MARAQSISQRIIRWLPVIGISAGLHGLALAGIIEGVRGATIGPKGAIELHLVRGEKPPKRKVQAPEGPKPRPPRAATGRRQRPPKRRPKRRVRVLQTDLGPREAISVAPARAPAAPPTPLSQPALGPAALPAASPRPEPASPPSARVSAPPKRGPTRGARLLSDDPRPVYPRLARFRGEEGVASVRLEIRSDGGVGKVELAKSSGSALLDRAALRAVRRWRFSPALDGGRAVAGWVRVPVRFELRR